MLKNLTIFSDKKKINFNQLSLNTPHKTQAKRARKERVAFEESHHVRLQMTKKQRFNENRKRQGNDFDQLTNFSSNFLKDDPLEEGGRKKRSRGKKRRRN